MKRSVMRTRPSFGSNAEFFAFVEAYINRLRAKGYLQAAVRLSEGYRSLNGLTDGWALFLEALESVRAQAVAPLELDDRDELELIRSVVRRAVYRRR